MREPVIHVRIWLLTGRMAVSQFVKWMTLSSPGPREFGGSPQGTCTISSLPGGASLEHSLQPIKTPSLLVLPTCWLNRTTNHQELVDVALPRKTLSSLEAIGLAVTLYHRGV